MDVSEASRQKLSSKNASLGGDSRFLAEAEGFEPPVPDGTAVFKTAAFDHSATPPRADVAESEAEAKREELKMAALFPGWSL